MMQGLSTGKSAFGVQPTIVVSILFYIIPFMNPIYYSIVRIVREQLWEIFKLLVAPNLQELRVNAVMDGVEMGAP